jgi:hypothetical protein
MRHAVLALCLIAGGFVSAPATAAETAARAKETSDRDTQIVCRRYPVIGSRTQKQRICKSRRDWATQENSMRDSVDDWQQRSLQGAGRGS